MDNEKKIHGTLTVTKRVVNTIVKGEKDQWTIHGHSELQFGFIHPWEIGPLDGLRGLAKCLFEIDHGNKNIIS
jgi:hypothetical protein